MSGCGIQRVAGVSSTTSCVYMLYSRARLNKIRGVPLARSHFTFISHCLVMSTNQSIPNKFQNWDVGSSTIHPRQEVRYASGFASKRLKELEEIRYCSKMYQQHEWNHCNLGSWLFHNGKS
jgi:hypothetical protein